MKLERDATPRTSGARRAIARKRRFAVVTAAVMATVVTTGASRAIASDAPGEAADVSGRDTPSLAGRGQPVAWPARDFALGDALLTAAAAALTTTTLLIGPDEDTPRRGGVFIDESVRDALRLPSRRGRLIARDTSDVLLGLSVSYPFLVDALVVAAWYRNSPATGGQLALVTAEALAIMLAVHSTTTTLFSRERPFGRTCGSELDGETYDCVASNRYKSLFSGHTSQSFAAAAAVCSHHRHVALYGGGAWDSVVCGLSLSVAALTGTLRIVSDQHYFTDVATGALVGGALGFLVPELGYHATSSGTSLRVVPTPHGIGVGGNF
jgi:membrane-associated phospholipid phosphatase